MFVAVNGGRPKAAFCTFTFVVSFFAAFGERPRAASQCIQVCVIILATHGVQPNVAFQYIQVHSVRFCWVWWAAEGRFPVYSSMQLPSLLRMAVGRRPFLSVFRFVINLIVVYGGRPKAASRYRQALISWFLAYGWQPNNLLLLLYVVSACRPPYAGRPVSFFAAHGGLP